VPELDLDADLRLRVTDPAGKSTTARITGTGRELRIEVEEPGVLFAAMDSADVGRAAELLAATGITARVVGPHGPAATIGAGTSSRLGKIVTGSSAVSPTPRATARVALAMRSVQAAAAISVGLVLLAVRQWRRGRSDPAGADHRR
jgi:hypothetical protein